MLLQIQSSTSVTAVLPDKFVANENLQHLRVDSPKLTLQTVSVCGFAKTWVMCLGRNGACCYKLQIQTSTSVTGTVTAVLPAKFNEDLQHLRVDSPKLTLQTVSVCGFAKTWLWLCRSRRANGMGMGHAARLKKRYSRVGKAQFDANDFQHLRVDSS